jgi:hypothetical protein
MSWGGMREGARGEWDQLVDRVHKVNGTAIISHEVLAAARPGQVKRALAAFEGAEIHLVYSARDLARQIPAEWQEGVKHRGRKTFAKFLDGVQKSPRRRSRLWFWRVQGLPDVLGRWARNLPPENIHLVTVPQDGAPRDELWRRYLQAFGLDAAWLPLDSPRENVSIGSAEVTLIRELNRRLHRADSLESAAYRSLVRELVVHQTLAQREDMVRATLPPEAYPWANEVAEEWIEWAEGSGIEVIGDLADLRPAPPSRGVWLNPDKPRPRLMIDAALEAIQALLAEAAAAPTPSPSPLRRARAKLRRP